MVLGGVRRLGSPGRACVEGRTGVMKYERVLLKLSGEVFGGGKSGAGILEGRDGSTVASKGRMSREDVCLWF